MELLEYIKKNYKTPNIAVLRTLGASEELIKYLINTPNNTNMKVVESLINGDDEARHGIKSINISPAITTTPALESLFPIYWEDLTEDQKRDGITISCTWGDFTPGEYTLTVEPTGNWYAGIQGWSDSPQVSGKGESVTASTAPAPATQFTVVGLSDPNGEGDMVLVNITLKKSE